MKHKIYAFTLAESGQRPHLNPGFGRSAFTLAELLIALAVIGIVAALTLTTVIQNYQEKVTVIRLKKVYSVLSQAMSVAVYENGTINTWQSTVTDDISNGQKTVWDLTPLIEQLKLIKDCGYNSEGCFKSGVYKHLNGTPERDFENLGRYHKVILSDGTLVALEGYAVNRSASPEDNRYGEIWVDTNGHKFPNTTGKDTFIFIITLDGIVPFQYDIYNINSNLPLSKSSCRLNSANGAGYDCTPWVLTYENLDYLHCNDLSFGGKTKCK